MLCLCQNVGKMRPSLGHEAPLKEDASFVRDATGLVTVRSPMRSPRQYTKLTSVHFFSRDTFETAPVGTALTPKPHHSYTWRFLRLFLYSPELCCSTCCANSLMLKCIGWAKIGHSLLLRVAWSCPDPLAYTQASQIEREKPIELAKRFRLVQLCYLIKLLLHWYRYTLSINGSTNNSPKTVQKSRFPHSALLVDFASTNLSP